MNTINKKDVEEIKDFYDVDLVREDDLDNIKNNLKLIGRDSILLSKTFLICYDYLTLNTYLIPDEKILQKLKDYFKNFSFVMDLRELIENYGEGNEIGSYYAKQNIKESILKYRENMLDLINFFMELFGEEY